MHLCFRSFRARRAEDESDSHEDLGGPKLSQAQADRRTRAADLKNLLLATGVQPTVVSRSSVVVNLECINEAHAAPAVFSGSTPISQRSRTAIPEVGDGSDKAPFSRLRDGSGPLPPGVSVPSPLGLPPGRGFVRLESTRRPLLYGQTSQTGSVEALRSQSLVSCASQQPDLIAQQSIQPAQQPSLPAQQPSQPAQQPSLLTQHAGLAAHQHSLPLQPEVEVDEQLNGTDSTLSPGKRALNWTASRRALAVLVVREEHLSRTDKGIQSQSHDRRLDERLQRLNLDMLTMAGDGNCQFRTLAHELYGSQEYHLTVRSNVIKHIRSNQEEYESFLGEDFEAYVTSMARPCTWGDELTLRAACDAYGVVVYVITSDAQNWFLTYEPQTVNEASGGELFLAYIAPIHYNAIRRKASLRILSKQLSSSFKRLADSGRINTGGSSRVP